MGTSSSSAAVAAPWSWQGAATTSQSNSNSNSNNKKTVRVFIEIISDTMCPWCWVGKRQLEWTLQELLLPEVKDELEITSIRWFPFLLDKDLAEEGTSTEDYYQKNYGDAQTGERLKRHLVPEGRKMGLDFTAYCQVTHFTPTLKSHCLMEYARQNYGNAVQNDMAEGLFRLFCQHGKALGNLHNLLQVAQEVLPSTHEVEQPTQMQIIPEYIQSPATQKAVVSLADSVKPKANGVPTFLFSLVDYPDIQYTFSGAQSPEVFYRVFLDLIAHQRRLDKLR